MKISRFWIPVGIAAGILCVSCHRFPAPTGISAPGPAWLLTGEGPHTLVTKVKTTGVASLVLIRDLSLMAPTQDTVLSMTVSIGPDSTLTANLGRLEDGFYEVRLNDSLRFNIGVNPDGVVSPPDAPEDFDAFWEETFKELDAVPLEPTLTLVPDYSNDIRVCYEVRYPSFGGAVAGGILSVPVNPGRYPVCLQYMGYGAPTYYFDPAANPDRIDFLVSVRDQGIFRAEPYDWIDRGIDSKENYYYRGAFCDVKRAVDFVVSLEKADPDRIVAWGESQGGAFTFLSAALDPRVKAIAPAVPFLGDYRDYARIVEWPVHEVFAAADKAGIPREDLLSMLRYFDIKNFAPRITCPVYMAFGLQDPTCPPHTNFAIYNNLGTKDKRYYCVPTCGHAMWLESSWSAERDAFIAARL